MHDVTKPSDIIEGMYVKIKDSECKIISGKVREVVSKDDNEEGVLVFLVNGVFGNVTEIINSTEKIIERVMDIEKKYSENKENFYEKVMQTESIPKTIQSFLNGKGGYLYIGISDSGTTIDNTIIGLENEKELCEQSEGRSLTNSKFHDLYNTHIEDSLEKYLRCEIPIDDFLDWNFIEIPIKDTEKRIILEITILPCKSPVFYKNLTSKHKEKNYKLFFNNASERDRKIDEFQYRQGSRKAECETLEEFFEYYKKRF